MKYYTMVDCGSWKVIPNTFNGSAEILAEKRHKNDDCFILGVDSNCGKGIVSIASYHKNSGWYYFPSSKEEIYPEYKDGFKEYVLEFSKIVNGQYGWQIECHDGGKTWWQNVTIPPEWGIIKQETLREGNPHKMGKYKIIFASGEQIKKLRRQFEDFLRKTSSENIWKIVENSYQLGGPHTPYIYEEEEY